MKTMGAARFKAQCLSTLDVVAATREPVVVTKNGKAVAQVIPMPTEQEDSIFGFLQEQIESLGDVMSSAFTDEEYETFLETSATQHTEPR